MKIVVVVPVFNENIRAQKTIKGILKHTKSEIVVVDDGSADETYKLLRKAFKNNPRVHVLRHIINLGKGAAMRTGMKMAWKLGASGVIFIDADGQHNPVLLPKFESALEKYDAVFGYRDLNDKMPLIRKYGNMVAKKNIEFAVPSE